MYCLSVKKKGRGWCGEVLLLIGKLLVHPRHSTCLFPFSQCLACLHLQIHTNTNTSTNSNTNFLAPTVTTAATSPACSLSHNSLLSSIYKYRQIHIRLSKLLISQLGFPCAVKHFTPMDNNTTVCVTPAFKQHHSAVAQNTIRPQR